jgi:hypothetical protein
MTLFLLLGVAITAGSLLYIFFPLLRTGGFLVDFDSNPSLVKQLLHKKKTIYENMKDLEFEYKMGKLAEEDYQKLREDYSREAFEVINQIESLQPEKLEKAGQSRIVSVIKNDQNP